MSQSNPNPGKTFYPDDDTAEWIEAVADENDRSESYIMSQVVQIVAGSTDGTPENFEAFKRRLKSSLTDIDQ